MERLNNPGNEQQPARIGQAWAEAAEQRQRDRHRLEGYVDAGLDPDDAESLIEFEHMMRRQDAEANPEPRPQVEDDETPGTVTDAAEARGRGADSAPAGGGERQPASPERARQATPRIYVASLADYNNGVLHGVWIDADQDPDGLRAEIAAMLAQSTQEVAEDWAIHDYEGFGLFRVGEFASLAVVSAVAQGIAEHGPAFAAYAARGDTSEETLRAFRDCYLGHWPSLDAYARDVAEDFGWETEIGMLPEDMREYVSIDYQAIARFVETAMTVVEGGGGIYIFSE